MPCSKIELLAGKNFTTSRKMRTLHHADDSLKQHVCHRELYIAVDGKIAYRQEDDALGVSLPGAGGRLKLVGFERLIRTSLK
jgi:type IV secretory pathway protease TraF